MDANRNFGMRLGGSRDQLIQYLMALRDICERMLNGRNLPTNDEMQPLYNLDRTLRNNHDFTTDEWLDALVDRAFHPQ